MRSQRVTIMGLLLLAVGACRTDPAVTMLEQENRQLEDVIYRQQDVIEEYRRALDGCRAAEAAAVPTPAETLVGPHLGSGRAVPKAPPPSERSPRQDLPEKPEP